MNKPYNISVLDLLDNKFGKLFNYSEDEVKNFVDRYDIISNRNMCEVVSSHLSPGNIELDNRINNIIHFIQTLDEQHLSILEEYIQDFTDENPNMLWNMLHKKDKSLYKSADKFYEWISTLDDATLENYIFKAADRKPLHPEYIYIKKQAGTQVDILDGYITISSSNLIALDKFKDRMLAANACEYEHRIKKHGEITIHSYIFNMNKNK